MDSQYHRALDKFLPIALQEIDGNTNVGPYDDDGETKQHCPSAHEVNMLLNVRMRLQKRQPKSSRH
jgi:hypothetical protein